jgi:hypothetical protein
LAVLAVYRALPTDVTFNLVCKLFTFGHVGAVRMASEERKTVLGVGRQLNSPAAKATPFAANNPVFRSTATTSPLPLECEHLNVVDSLPYIVEL